MNLERKLDKDFRKKNQIRMKILLFLKVFWTTSNIFMFAGLDTLARDPSRHPGPLPSPRTVQRQYLVRVYAISQQEEPLPLPPFITGTQKTCRVHRPACQVHRKHGMYIEWHVRFMEQHVRYMNSMSGTWNTMSGT